MPRGVPKAGFRKTSKVKIRDISEVNIQKIVETDAEISERILERFDILDEMTHAAIKGDIRALIVSGPAGLGKSFTVEEALKGWDASEENHTIVKGHLKAPSLYRLLFQHKDQGKVLVFDDADAIFFDDISLNLLKAACDSNKVRRISYMTEGTLIDETDMTVMPKSFEFEGTIIFITNLDFDAMIGKGHKLAPHMNAMISRSHYIDLTMKTKRDYMIRIKQVLDKGMLDREGIAKAAQVDVVSFIETHQNTMRELSLRMVLKVAGIRNMNSPKWMSMAKVTCTYL